MSQAKGKKENITSSHIRSPESREKIELLAIINSERKLVRKLALIVSLVAFILYANTLNHGYVLDDYSLIVENSITKKGLDGIKEIFSTTYRSGFEISHDELYRPVSKTLLAIEWGMNPGNPATGHWINVLLYCLTGFILMSTLYEYFKSINLSFITSLLFISHPIHTEVVSNIKSSDEILAFLFSILALKFSYNYITQTKPKHLIYSILFFLLAMFSKESSIVFPFLFLLTWYFFSSGNRKTLVHLMAGFISVGVIFFIARYFVVGNIISTKALIIDNSLIGAPSFIERFSTAVYIMGLYLKLLIFPHPLIFNYSYNYIPIVLFTDARFLFPFIILLSSIIFAIIKIKSKSIWSYGILFFFISASIVSNIFILIGTEMGERLMFMPSLGFCIVIGYILNKYFGTSVSKPNFSKLFSQNRKLYLFVTVILIAYSIKASGRNTDWKNNYTLFTHDIELVPESARAHFCLGNCLLKEIFFNSKNEYEKESTVKMAIEELKKSLVIYPAYSDARNELGVAYYNLKKYDEALAVYLESSKYFPDEPTVYNNIGSISFVMGKYSESELAFRKAIRLKPDYLDAYVNLVSVLQKADKNTEASIVISDAINKFPNNTRLYELQSEISQQQKIN